MTRTGVPRRGRNGDGPYGGALLVIAVVLFYYALSLWVLGVPLVFPFDLMLIWVPLFVAIGMLAVFVYSAWSA